MKTTITESQLNSIITKSIKKVFNENFNISTQNNFHNLIMKGDRIFFDGEQGWFMKKDENGEYDVYDDGEWEGKYCGSLHYLENLPNGGAALDYVISGL